MTKIYEAIHLFGKKMWNLEAHLERLEKSADHYGIEVPENLQSELDKLAEKSELDESYFLIIISKDNLKIIQKPYSRIAESGQVITFKGERPSPKAKTWDLPISIEARNTAKEAGAIDSLFVTKEGKVPEGATSNVFIVKDGILITPTSHALSGTTQDYVLKLAEELRIPTEIRDLQLEEVLNSDELFITSALKLIMPITQVDETTVNNGTIGPVTKKILDALNQKIDENNRS